MGQTALVAVRYLRDLLSVPHTVPVTARVAGTLRGVVVAVADPIRG